MNQFNGCSSLFLYLALSFALFSLDQALCLFVTVDVSEQKRFNNVILQHDYKYVQSISNDIFQTDFWYNNGQSFCFNWILRSSHVCTQLLSQQDVSSSKACGPGHCACVCIFGVQRQFLSQKCIQLQRNTYQTSAIQLVGHPISNTAKHPKFCNRNISRHLFYLNVNTHLCQWLEWFSLCVN